MRKKKNNKLLHDYKNILLDHNAPNERKKETTQSMLKSLSSALVVLVSVVTRTSITIYFNVRVYVQIFFLYF